MTSREPNYQPISLSRHWRHNGACKNVSCAYIYFDIHQRNVRSKER